MVACQLMVTQYCVCMSAYGCKHSILFVEHLFFKLKRRPVFDPQIVPVTGLRSAKNQVCHITLCHKSHMIPTKKTVLNWTETLISDRSENPPNPNPMLEKLVNLFCQLLGSHNSNPIADSRHAHEDSHILRHLRLHRNGKKRRQLGVRNYVSVRRSSNPEMPGRKNSLTHEFQDLALL